MANTSTIRRLQPAKSQTQAGTSQQIAYHSGMRVVLFALMIALLPLRGWMGDAMATEMALAQLQPTQSTAKIMASHAHGTSAGADFYHEAGAPEAVQEGPVAHDCAEPASDDAFHAGNAYCGSCAACQACHTVALFPMAADLNNLVSERTLPRAASTPFASAEAALDQKPPIS